MTTRARKAGQGTVSMLGPNPAVALRTFPRSMSALDAYLSSVQRSLLAEDAHSLCRYFDLLNRSLLHDGLLLQFQGLGNQLVPLNVAVVDLDATAWPKFTTFFLRSAVMLYRGHDLVNCFEWLVSAVDQFNAIFEKSTNWIAAVLYHLLRALRKVYFRLPLMERTKSSRRSECTDVMQKCVRAIKSDKSATPETSRMSSMLFVGIQLMRFYSFLDSPALVKLQLQNLVPVDVLGRVGSNLQPAEELRRELAVYPAAHRVSLHFFRGMLAAYECDPLVAEESLGLVERILVPRSPRKRYEKSVGRVAALLVPVRILQGKLPNIGSSHPQYRKVAADFQRLITAVRRSDVRIFEQFLLEKQDMLMGSGLFLMCQMVRLVLFREMFRKTYLALLRIYSQAPTTRFRLFPFTASLRYHGMKDATEADTEGILASLIFKGLVKGYIAHDRGVVVFAPKDAFPALTDVFRGMTR